MGDKPINLELAKKIKELGYNTPCEFYYQDIDLPYSPKGLKKTKNGEKLNHNDYDDFVYSAPSLLDAMLHIVLIKRKIYKIEKFHEKLKLNTYYPASASANYHFFDPAVAEEITRESKEKREKIQYFFENCLEVPNKVLSLLPNNPQN